MLDGIMNSTNFNYLPRAMTAANMRQEVISNNIANVNTPNYRRKNVTFEDALALEIYGEKVPEGKLQMARTHREHLPFKPSNIHAVPGGIVDDKISIMRADNNSVDVDVEMATLAKNQIYYNALATQLGGYITKMRNAITSGQS